MNQISLQIINLLIIIGMSIFIVIDFFRHVNYPIVLSFRAVQLLMALFIFYYARKQDLSASRIDNLTFLTFFFQAAFALSLAFVGSMPSFFFTNITVTILVFVTTISGLRFKSALFFNSGYLVAFILFSQFFHQDQFYFSQYANIFLMFIYSAIAGALIESRRRKTFLQYEDLSLQKKKVEELNQQKNKIISVLAHDVASPIHSLSGLLVLHETGQIKDHEVKPFVKDVRKRLDSVSTLVFGLVRWSRSQLDGFVAEKKAIDLAHLVEEIAELFRPAARDKSIQIKVDSQSVLKIYCDEEMIRIAIRDLVSNAVKFSIPGTEILIKAACENGLVKTTVVNCGAAISPDAHKKLFSYQVSSSEGTKGEKGTGLGLAMASYFAKVNEGKIYLEQTPSDGKKITFVMELPEKK